MARKARVYPVRPLRIVGDVAYVPLSQGLEAIVDAVDAALVGQWNWTAHRYRSGRITAFRKDGVKTVELHRAIMPPNGKLYVDHVDGDALNNRRSNLRYATHAQNIRNMRPRVGRELPKGVCFEPRTGRFTAEICHDYKRHHLGTFDTAEEASAARVAAEMRLFGEFRRAA